MEIIFTDILTCLIEIFLLKNRIKSWLQIFHTYTQSKGGLYLSVIRDLYDNSIVAYKTGTEQNVNLVLSTIKEAKGKEKVTAELQLHSDQGFQLKTKLTPLEKRCQYVA